MKLDILSYLDSVGPGWNKLLADCLQELEDMCNLKGYDVEILQIKEKYGFLTIYLSSYFPELEEIIDRYVHLSGFTCERCGKEGETLKVNGWWTTICKECLDERKIK